MNRLEEISACESFEKFIILNFPAYPLFFGYVGFDLVFDSEFVIHAKAPHKLEVFQVMLKNPLLPPDFYFGVQLS
jgi:hypothetical protein